MGNYRFGRLMGWRSQELEGLDAAVSAVVALSSIKVALKPKALNPKPKLQQGDLSGVQGSSFGRYAHLSYSR